MSINVSISGLSQMARKFDSYKKTKTEELRDETNATGLRVERKAKKKVPVRDGPLRASIHTVPAGTRHDGRTGISTDDLEAAVATNKKYAWRIEKGFHGTDALGRTYAQAAQPYMFPSWESERPEYIRKVKSILRKL